MAAKKYESYINLSPDALLAMPHPTPPKLKRTKRSFGIPEVDDGNGNNTQPEHLQYKVNGIVKRIIKRPLARPRRKGDTKKLKNITGKRRSKTKNITRTRSKSKSKSKSRSRSRSRSRSISRSRSRSGSGNKNKKM